MNARRKALSNRQRAFVAYYLQSASGQTVDGIDGRQTRNTYLNATQSARQAGYAHPHVAGSRLLKNVKVRAAIQAHMEELEIRSYEILLREYDIAKGDIGDFADVFAESSVPAALRKTKEYGISHLIKKIRQTDNGVDIQLHDAHQARELLGRRLGLWEEKNERFDPTKLSPVLLNVMNASPEDVRRALDRLRSRKAGHDKGRRALSGV